MNLVVAVKTIFHQQVLVRAAPGQSLRAIGQARVKRDRVALLAQGWPSDIQQPGVDGTVRPVTRGAVLGRRRMFPQERAAFVLMTAVAIIVD